MSYEIGFKPARDVTTQADFTCSITPDTISITDTGKGRRSVTNDIEAVLRKIEYWHQGSIRIKNNVSASNAQSSRSFNSLTISSRNSAATSSSASNGLRYVESEHDSGKFVDGEVFESVRHCAQAA